MVVVTPLLLLLLLQGCSTSQVVIPVEDRTTTSLSPASTITTSISTSTSTQTVTAPTWSEPVMEESSTDPLSPLLQDIDKNIEQGKIERAEMLIERALRIDSERPSLWSSFAEIKFRQESYKESVTLAKKSNLLLGDNRDKLRKINWRIMARSREKLGDSAGASRAWIEFRGL